MFKNLFTGKKSKKTVKSGNSKSDILNSNLHSSTSKLQSSLVNDNINARSTTIESHTETTKLTMIKTLDQQVENGDEKGVKEKDDAQGIIEIDDQLLRDNVNLTELKHIKTYETPDNPKHNHHSNNTKLNNKNSSNLRIKEDSNSLIETNVIFTIGEELSANNNFDDYSKKLKKNLKVNLDGISSSGQNSDITNQHLILSNKLEEFPIDENYTKKQQSAIKKINSNVNDTDKAEMKLTKTDTFNNKNNIIKIDDNMYSKKENENSKIEPIISTSTHNDNTEKLKYKRKSSIVPEISSTGNEMKLTKGDIFNNKNNIIKIDDNMYSKKENENSKIEPIISTSTHNDNTEQLKYKRKSSIVQEISSTGNEMKLTKGDIFNNKNNIIKIDDNMYSKKGNENSKIEPIISTGTHNDNTEQLKYKRKSSIVPEISSTGNEMKLTKGDIFNNKNNIIKIDDNMYSKKGNENSKIEPIISTSTHNDNTEQLKYKRKSSIVPEISSTGKDSVKNNVKIKNIMKSTLNNNGNTDILFSHQNENLTKKRNSVKNHEILASGLKISMDTKLNIRELESEKEKEKGKERNIEINNETINANADINKNKNTNIIIEDTIHDTGSENKEASIVYIINSISNKEMNTKKKDIKKKQNNTEIIDGKASANISNDNMKTNINSELIGPNDISMNSFMPEKPDNISISKNKSKKNIIKSKKEHINDKKSSNIVNTHPIDIPTVESKFINNDDISMTSYAYNNMKSSQNIDKNDFSMNSLFMPPKFVDRKNDLINNTSSYSEYINKDEFSMVSYMNKSREHADISQFNMSLNLPSEYSQNSEYFNQAEFSISSFRMPERNSDLFDESEFSKTRLRNEINNKRENNMSMYSSNRPSQNSEYINEGDISMASYRNSEYPNQNISMYKKSEQSLFNNTKSSYRNSEYPNQSISMYNKSEQSLFNNTKSAVNSEYINKDDFSILTFQNKSEIVDSELSDVIKITKRIDSKHNVDIIKSNINDKSNISKSPLNPGFNSKISINSIVQKENQDIPLKNLLKPKNKKKINKNDRSSKAKNKATNFDVKTYNSTNSLNTKEIANHLPSPTIAVSDEKVFYNSDVDNTTVTTSSTSDTSNDNKVIDISILKTPNDVSTGQSVKVKKIQKIDTNIRNPITEKGTSKNIIASKVIEFIPKDRITGNIKNKNKNKNLGGKKPKTRKNSIVNNINLREKQLETHKSQSIHNIIVELKSEDDASAYIESLYTKSTVIKGDDVFLNTITHEIKNGRLFCKDDEQKCMVVESIHSMKNNVHLTDLRKEPIVEFPDEGIRAEGTVTHNSDCIIVQVDEPTSATKVNKDHNEQNEATPNEDKHILKKPHSQMKFTVTSKKNNQDDSEDNNTLSKVMRRIRNNCCCISLLILLLMLILYIYYKTPDEKEEKNEIAI